MTVKKEYVVESLQDGEWVELDCYDTLEKAKSSVTLRISMSMKKGKQWRILIRTTVTEQYSVFQKK